MLVLVSRVSVSTVAVVGRFCGRSRRKYESKLFIDVLKACRVASLDVVMSLKGNRERSAAGGLLRIKGIVVARGGRERLCTKRDSLHKQQIFS